MEKMILILHIAVCVVLVILVLLQSGKEGMGVIFGGGSSSLFGSTGAGGILVKLTTFVAVIFLATSLSYTMLTSVKTKQESSIIDIPIDDPFSAPAPQTPAAPAESAPAASPASPAAPATPESSAAPATPESSAAPATPENTAVPASPASSHPPATSE